MDKFFRESHYNIIRILLSISGLWPYHTVTKRCTIYFVFLLVFGSGLTFEVLGLIDVWPDSFEVVDCLPLLVLGAVSIAKLACAMYTLPEIKILLTKMRQYWYSPKSDEETKILHSYALYGRNLGYAYTGILLSHTVVFVFTTLLTKLLYVESIEDESSLNNAHGAQAGLPYRVNYMVDLETYYVPIFLHTALCDVFYTLLMITFDVLYLTLVQHCCGLFAALRYRLESAFEYQNNSDDITPIATKDKLYSNIVYSIRRHAEAIQFAAVMESIHRIPLFVHVGANISLLSIVGFQVITNTEDINHMLKHASYLSALLLNTFFENWQGQKMINSSEKVYESAYVSHNIENVSPNLEITQPSVANINKVVSKSSKMELNNFTYNTEWYNMPIMQRKLLIMIMLRSKKPLRITAGKFIVLSYVNFNAVLRASSSYFMLLRSIQ